MIYFAPQLNNPHPSLSSFSTLFLPMPGRDLPSFSLGLDSDSDTDPDPQARPESDQVRDSDVELDPTPETAPEPPRVLRRLKRGPSAKQQLDPFPVSGSDPDASVDDDIEDFSSQEEPTPFLRDDKLPIQHHSICSSSKFPLLGKRVLPASLSSQSKATDCKKALDDQVSASLKTKFNNSIMFPELTPSPLRKFHLVDSDSDSDGPFMNKHANGGARTINSSINLCKQPAPLTQQKINDAYKSVPSKVDLLKDFSPVKSFRIPTPALDEFCQELSHPVKDRAKTEMQTSSYVSNGDGSLTKNSHTNKLHQQESKNLPPSHRYFFHDDPNIQGLVRSRLPHFFPLSGTNDRDRNYKQTAGSVINYMSQFGNLEASQKLAAQKVDVDKGSKGRSTSKSSTTDEPSCPGSWVSCKVPASTPKNAGKRRVQASEKSAGTGHWYTAPNGIKVYVTAKGEELTGQSAYRYYRKESGSRFKRSKQKPKAKKKVKG